MKKLLIIAGMFSLFFVAGCGTTSLPQVTPTTTTPTSTTITTPKASLWYTLQDVQKHNKNNDCWTVVEGKIYDMSDFASLHSGWPDSITSICGKDGTSMFAKQHGTQTALIQQYFVANLK